jgi:hypothetical protein
VVVERWRNTFLDDEVSFRPVDFDSLVVAHANLLSQSLGSAEQQVGNQPRLALLACRSTKPGLWLDGALRAPLTLAIFVRCVLQSRERLFSGGTFILSIGTITLV